MSIELCRGVKQKQKVTALNFDKREIRNSYEEPGDIKQWTLVEMTFKKFKRDEERKREKFNTIERKRKDEEYAEE